MKKGMDLRELANTLMDRKEKSQDFQVKVEEITFEPTVEAPPVVTESEDRSMLDQIIDKHGLGKTFWYILVGFDSTFEEDLHRINLLRDRGQEVWVQRYNEMRQAGVNILYRWANQKKYFWSSTFEEWLATPETRRKVKNNLKECEEYFGDFLKKVYG